MYWSTSAIFEYLSDCAIAFGTRKHVQIASTKTMTMILIVLSLTGALIASYPFVAAARSA